jgi:hypothetical protein
MADAERPWSVPVRVDEVPETGRHVEIEANEATRAALAKPSGVDTVERLSARFDLNRRGRDGLHVTGEVSGTVRQTCIVTLEPVVNEVAETIALDFAPPRNGHEAAEIDLDPTRAAEEPEPLAGNSVDLGVLATEFFFLGIDRYPRKPGAAFDAPKAPSDPASHPFAGLADWQKKSTVKK